MVYVCNFHSCLDVKEKLSIFLDPAVETANVKGQDHVTGRRGEEGLRGHPVEAVQAAADLGRSRGHPGGHQ